jgi:hypothetical protein
MNAQSSAFLRALHAAGPAADRADRMGLYAWLVGSWALDAAYHLDDGSIRRAEGEVHAGWALEGRAIQDVWIVPPRGAPRSEPPFQGDFYGTTLRVYDPEIDAWRIFWIDPVKQNFPRMIGRARGRDIVQEGEDASGAPIRWSFTDIAPNSFRWRAERSGDGGASWRLQVEFNARRIAG